MNYDKFGIPYVSEDELCKLLYAQPDLDLSRFQVIDPKEFNRSVDVLFAEVEKLKTYIPQDLNVDEFDQVQQAHWYMPKEYRQLDVAKWVLDQCKSEPELQRCGAELLLYQQYDLFNLLRYLKYLVDTLRTNKIVWGVGRGSSVSSFVLYKIGVHKIDSLRYDLDIAEFLK